MVVRNVREDEGAALLEMLESLRQAAQGQNDVTIRILAANDPDGVCAAKILTTVLEKKGLKHLVMPVSGNSDIADQLQQLESDAEVRSLVMLNCGASLDMQQSLEECGAPAGLRCYVIDAHRPFLLANLSRRAERVVVFDDDPRQEDLSGTRPPIDEDDDSSEGESAAGEDFGEEGSGLTPGSADSLEREQRKRKREVLQLQRLEKKRQRVNDYYLCSYCAMPTAVSLFKLARQAALASQDLLWAASIALVSYHEQGFLSKLHYDRLAWEELKESLDQTEDFNTMSAPSADPTQTQGSEDEASAPTRRAVPRSMMSSKKQLRFEADFRLHLYKHWTLEDSMHHSGYFYGTLELHRDKGARALKNYFATAGISPAQYKQMYSCMPYPIRRTLHDKLSEFGKAYGLTKEKMFLQQFVRNNGVLGDSARSLWLDEISCSDAAHMLLTVLSVLPSSLSNTQLDHLPQLENGRRDVAEIMRLERQAMQENFWKAFDTILCKSLDPLKDGIGEAVEVAKAVQSLGRFIKDTNAMRRARLFQYCKIEQPPHIFRHHLAVRKLAVWLLQVFYTYRPKGECPERPILIIVRDHVHETYLCVGATPDRLSDDKDEFGHLFRNVLRADPSLKFRYDFFDKSCIEIAVDDFDRFWDLLCS